MNTELKDRIAGAIVGYAIGDALGLSTELMSREEVQEFYPGGVNDYQDMIMDAHRSQWGAGNYTHDTVFVTMLIENIMQNGKIDPDSFARRISKWYGHGHYDISTHLRALLSNPEYTDDPDGVSKETFRKLGHMSETDGVLGIAMIAGMAAEDPLTEPEALVHVIEAGPLAAATTHAVAHIAHAMLWDKHIPDTAELIKATDQCSGDIDSSLEAAAEMDGIDRLEIDDEDEMWLASKCLGASLWSLWHFDSFEEGLKHVVMLGGDADTNAALTGGFFGLRLGLSAIPESWKTGLHNYKEIEDIANRFADYLIAKKNN